jgi:DNA polymerase III sliding clamp (beta) subunit (PCNA family)
MDRQELVKKLELLKPALADSLVPVLQCYQFTGKRVIANNDELAILAPCETTSPFAANGRTLLGLLQNSTSHDVDLKTSDDNQLTIHTGRSAFKLPYFTEDEFIFEEPIDGWTPAFIPINPTQLLDGFRACLTTVSRDMAKPALMGITVRHAAKRIVLYSCDGDALTRFVTSMEGYKAPDSVLPLAFCEAVLRTMDETEATEGELYLSPEWAKASINTGYTIYGRLLVIDNPINYTNLIKDTIKDEPVYFPIPDGLSPALSRARVLTDQESARTELKIEDGRLLLRTETHMGIVNDSLVIDAAPNVTADVSAELVQKMASQSEEMAVLTTCTAFRNEGQGLFQLVSNLG